MSVSKMERTFVLIYTENNFEKNMVEEIFNQYKIPFFSQKERNILAVKKRHIIKVN